MVKENPRHTVWIEAERWASGEWSPHNDSTDVIVTSADGSRWIATFLSYEYIRTLIERNRRSGENISGAYLWVRDMVLINEVSRSRIEEVVNDLIRTGDFELAFRYCSDEEIAVFDRK